MTSAKAFLFSLRSTSEPEPFKVERTGKQTQFSHLHDEERGPVWGGCELWIGDHASTAANSTSSIPVATSPSKAKRYSYFKIAGPQQQGSATFSLAGVSPFKVSEMEVFRVVRGEVTTPQPQQGAGTSASQATGARVKGPGDVVIAATGKELTLTRTLEDLSTLWVASLREEAEAIAEARDAFRAAEAAFDKELAFMQQHMVEQDIISLNVMGTPIDVSAPVLRLYQDSMIAAMFNREQWQDQEADLDEDGRYFMVREG